MFLHFFYASLGFILTISILRLAYMKIKMSFALTVASKKPLYTYQSVQKHDEQTMEVVQFKGASDVETSKALRDELSNDLAHEVR